MEFFYFNYLSEAELWSFCEEHGVENLQSAFLKLELGMATPAEQQIMAEFMKRLRNLISEMSSG